MISYKNYYNFITLIKSLWSELSNGILVDIWVQNLTPNQPISHRNPAIASSISFICVPHKNLQHHQPTPPGAETIPSISSRFEPLYVWFQHQVWLADGIVSWQHNTMSNQRQKGWIGGGYFHFLQAPFGAAVAKKHRLHAPSWSCVAAGAAQLPYWLLPLQQWRRGQCDASMMHRTLKSLINTINDN